MIKKSYNYFTIIILLTSSSALLYFIIGAIAMDKGIGIIKFSNSLKETEKEKTLINKYFVYHINGK